MRRGQKIAVAMSGGVDSSVAAALLKSQGHDVFGMMLRLWSEPGKAGSNRCCTPESMALARKAAAQLDIPFYVIDSKQAFRESVVDYFLSGYERGETPNPCLECNRVIRWTILLDHARALGAERMATGHYARLDVDAKGVFHLRRAADRDKDQSYVLHVLNQEQLGLAVFPLGEYHKPEVRQLAEAHGLPTATRRDSQDLCFLAGEDYRAFLGRHRPQMLVPGAIQDTTGRVLGEHTGLANYTIGQRKGLGLRSTEAMYVVAKDLKEGVLIVGDKSAPGADSLMTGPVHWLDGTPRREEFRARVQIRYTAKEREALVTPIEDGRRVKVTFEERQRDITPGQAAVFYAEDAVIGGGIIAFPGGNEQ